METKWLLPIIGTSRLLRFAERISSSLRGQQRAYLVARVQNIQVLARIHRVSGD